MKTRSSVITSLLLALAALTMAADDPFVGIWKLNVQKSTFAENLPAPISQLSIIEGQDNGQRCKSETNYGQWILQADYSARYDGKDYPVTAKPSLFDAISIKRLSPNSLEYVFKKEGKEMARWRYDISDNGKISTATTKTIVEGNTVSQVMVFEKQ
jgi:hypothetical protein